MSEKVTERELFPGITLHCVQTEKYHSGTFAVCFLRPLDPKTVSSDALLMNVLCRGSRSHPDLSSLEDAMNALYGSAIQPFIRQFGEASAIGLTADFPDETLLPNEAGYTGRVISLIAEILLDPLTSGGLLKKEYVLSERQQLCDRIEAIRNNRASYAVRQWRAAMFAGEPYACYALGSVKTAERIHHTGLTHHYRQVLAESPVLLFYVGRLDFEQIQSEVLRSFSMLPANTERVIPGTVPHVYTGDTLRRAEEVMAVKQAQLVLGFGRTGESFPETAALAVFNEMYGSGSSSALFRSLRGERSLCYSVYSSVDRFKETLYACLGFDAERLSECEELICSEFQRIREGRFSDEDLETAKRSVSAAYRIANDNPASLLSNRLASLLTGSDTTLLGAAAKAELMSGESVCRAAAAFRPEFSFLLSGGASA